MWFCAGLVYAFIKLSLRCSAVENWLSERCVGGPTLRGNQTNVLNALLKAAEHFCALITPVNRNAVSTRRGIKMQLVYLVVLNNAYRFSRLNSLRTASYYRASEDPGRQEEAFALWSLTLLFLYHKWHCLLFNVSLISSFILPYKIATITHTAH